MRELAARMMTPSHASFPCDGDATVRVRVTLRVAAGLHGIHVLLHVIRAIVLADLERGVLVFDVC